MVLVSEPVQIKKNLIVSLGKSIHFSKLIQLDGYSSFKNVVFGYFLLEVCSIVNKG